MTLDDLYRAILLTITQVRDVHRLQLRVDEKDYPMSVPSGGDPQANDAMLDDMARNVAQALVVLIDDAGGGPCPKCGSPFAFCGSELKAGPCCSLCGAVV